MQSEFILTNGLGIHIKPNEILDQLPNILRYTTKQKYSEDFNVEEFSLANTVDKLLDLI
jgi:hypothetical protein